VSGRRAGAAAAGSRDAERRLRFRSQTGQRAAQPAAAVAVYLAGHQRGYLAVAVMGGSAAEHNNF
jgi:hypothetical protein